MRQRRGIKSSLSLASRACVPRRRRRRAFQRGSDKLRSQFIRLYRESEAFDGQGSIIMLELADETGARRVALRMAGVPWERAARGRRRAL
jgi:hypothetical protein